MKAIRCFLAAALLACLIGASASAATYYVSTSGSDSNPGSSSQPWATLQKAVDTIANGDTILIKPGTYVGCKIRYGGTAGAPKTLKAETAGTVYVNQKGPINNRSSIIQLQHADFSSAVPYWVIEGLNVSDASTWGIDAMNAPNLTVRNCKSHHNGVAVNRSATGIFSAWGDNVLIEDCESYSNGEHGMYGCNSADYGIIRRSIMHDNKSLGNHMNGDQEMGGDGIMTGWLVERCTVYNNGSSGFDADGGEQFTWRNNLVYHSGNAGFQLHGYNAAIQARNNLIYNNTVVQMVGGNYCFNIYDNDFGQPAPVGNKVKNNILYHYNNVSGKGSINISSSAMPQFESDYNVVMDYFGIDDNDQIKTLAQWRAMGYDVHSIQASDTALFANPGSSDYRLRSGSPAINAGTTLASVTDDRDGNSRPQGGVYDIGCYEYTGGGGPADLIITTATLPDAAVNTAYSQTVQATGGITPYTWSIVSGALPSGLSLGSSTGTISGTPTTGGTYSFAVRVRDNQGTPDTDDQPFTIVVVSGTQLVLQNGVNGYTGTTDAWITADSPTTNYGSDVNGHLQYTTQDRQLLRFDLSTIPGGSTIQSATLSLYCYNAIEGTPYVAAYRVKTHWDEMQATYNNRLTSNAWGTPGLLADTDYDSTSIGSAGPISAGQWVSYDFTTLVTQWKNGTYANEGVMLKETSNGHLYTRLSEYTTDTTLRPKLVVIYSGGVQDLQVSTTSLPAGQVGVSYSQTLQASGGVSPYSWSIVSGSLPSGLSLSASAGVVSGAPTTPGTSNVTVRVTDSQGTPDTDDQALVLVVSPADLVVTTASLAGGTLGVSYSQTLAATGGLTPYSWSISSGSLPAGLTLASSTGVISGTPTTLGTASFTARCTDSQGTPDTATKALSIMIIAPDLAVTTTSLANGTAGAAYTQTLAATGGVTPYTWSVVSGTLPTGLTLTASTGVLSGTPSAAGTSNFTVRATDSQGTPDTDDQSLSITVAGGGGPATYYVATTGNDSWPGTLSQPWLTIQKAVDTVAGGDTIIVRNGTYAGARVRYSGSSGAVKTLKAESNYGAVINTPGSLCVKPCNLEVKDDVETDGVSYWQIEGFDITGSPNWGFEIQYGDHITVKNCKVHNSASANVTMEYSNYCTLDGIESYSPTSGSAFYLGYSGDYNTVIRSIGRNTASNGLFVTSAGLGDSICGNWTIEKNAFYSNGKMMTLDGVTGSVVRNNLGYGENKGMYLLGYESAATSNNNKLYNNTVITTAGGYFSFFIHKSTAGLPEGTTNKVKNNVLYNYDAGGLVGSICIDTLAETGFESDYNVVMSVFGLDDSAQILNLVNWRARGYEAHSVQAADAALFVNPGSSDYHLKAGSPAINAGTTLAEVTDDKDSVSRPSGSGYDIGCYEYGVADLVVTTASLPGGTVGAAYSQTLAATGGVTPYAWSVNSGTLPAGLTLGSSTGTISGTPTSAGTANFTVRVTDSQGAPDTYDKALSIVVGASSEPTYRFAASDGESSTTSTTYQTKTTLTFTPGVTDDYLILGFAEHKGNNTGYSSLVRMVVNGTPEGDITVAPTATSDYQSFVASKWLNFASGTTVTITIQYASENSAATTYVRNSRVVALRKASLEMANAGVGPSDLTTTLTDYVSLNFTPATAGDYLLIWTAEVYGNTNAYSTQVQAKLNGAMVDERLVESRDATDYSSFASFSVVNCPASQQTIAIAAAKETGSATVHKIRKGRITYIRLSDSRFAGYQSASSDTESTTTSTTFQEKLTRSWSVGTAGNWLMLSSFRVAGSSTSYNVEGRVQLDDATVQAQPLRRPQDTTDYMNAGSVDVRSLSAGTRRVDVDYRSGNASGTAKVRNARIVALPLN